MSVELLTEHHFEFLSLKGGCTGSSESILVKLRHCWKSHVAAPLMLLTYIFIYHHTGKCIRRIGGIYWACTWRFM